MQTNAAGQVMLELKTPWRDGPAGRARPEAEPFARHKRSSGPFVFGLSAIHLVMSPLEFMQRLAALGLRPRLHLIRFGGRITSLREVSGPPLRDHGVLAPKAELRALVVPQEAEPPAQEAKPAECEATCAHHSPLRLSRAKLLKRVFEIDMEHCPNCDGQLKIIAAILDQPVIEKILTHLGLLATAPPRAPARRVQLQAA